MKLNSHARGRGLSSLEAAARWAVRRDRGDIGLQEARELAAWREEPENALALDRAEDLLALFDAHRDEEPSLLALRQSALAVAPASPLRKALVGGLIAASVAAVAVTFVLVHPLAPRLASPAAPVAQGQETKGDLDAGELTTRVGEQRTIRLEDGTSVTLDTNSLVEVSYSARQRHIRLTRGQALFEVAHDPNRPFVVEAIDREVTALGTVFQVRVDPSKVNVLLIQGRVSVEQVDRLPGDKPVPTAILEPGQQFVAQLGMAQQVQRVDVSQQTLWRDGFLAFDNVSLHEAVGEINRYVSRPIGLGDDTVGSMRISGVFRTGSAGQFAEAVGAVLPVEMQSGDDGELELVRRARPNPSAH